MAKRNKYNTTVILDLNSDKIFISVEKKAKLNSVIDLKGIAKEELDTINATIRALGKKEKQADPKQYLDLMQARIYRKITFELKSFFGTVLADENDIKPEKLFIDLIVATSYKDGNAVMNMTDVELMGVVKQFFAGTKGISTTITKEAPKYNVKMSK